MISFINEIMNSTINSLVESLLFLSILIFYTLIVLRLPIESVFHLFGLLTLITAGLNVVLSNTKEKN